MIYSLPKLVRNTQDVKLLPLKYYVGTICLGAPGRLEPRRPPALARGRRRGARIAKRGAAERRRPRARLGRQVTPHVQHRARALRDGEL